MPRLGYHEISWQLLRNAETHHSHRMVSMITAVDRPPIFMWACPVGGCNGYAYTYHRNDPPPKCTGGYEWSYTTKPSHDR